MMSRVAGTGCVQGAVAAAFLGALGAKARWESAVAASLVVSLAGEFGAPVPSSPPSSTRWPP